MEIILNGEVEEVAAKLNLEELLVQKNLTPGQVVVEHNGDIIKKDELAKTDLEAKDQVEIISFVGGG